MGCPGAWLLVHQRQREGQQALGSSACPQKRHCTYHPQEKMVNSQAGEGLAMNCEGAVIRPISGPGTWTVFYWLCMEDMIHGCF